MSIINYRKPNCYNLLLGTNCDKFFGEGYRVFLIMCNTVK